MNFINNDNFTFDFNSNIITSRDQLPLTAYNDNYSVKLVSATPRGIRYVDDGNSANFISENGKSLVYGTITVTGTDADKVHLDTTQGFWGERVTCEVTRSDNYTVFMGFTGTITDQA